MRTPKVKSKDFKAPGAPPVHGTAVEETEVRAFVYQLLNGLDGELPRGASFDVMIRDSENGENTTARIVLKSELGQFAFEGSSGNVFEALRRSGEVMKLHLSELNRALIESVGDQAGEESEFRTLH